MQNKRPPMLNQKSCTELTLNGGQRGRRRNRTLEKTQLGENLSINQGCSFCINVFRTLSASHNVKEAAIVDNIDFAILCKLFEKMINQNYKRNQTNTSSNNFPRVIYTQLCHLYTVPMTVSIIYIFMLQMKRNQIGIKMYSSCKA